MFAPRSESKILPCLHIHKRIFAFAEFVIAIVAFAVAVAYPTSLVAAFVGAFAAPSSPIKTFAIDGRSFQRCRRSTIIANRSFHSCQSKIPL
jgi:hypothetical protein